MFQNMTGVYSALCRRDEALAFISERITRSGVAPSYGEIARAMRPKVHRSTAAGYVEELMKLGVIERDPASRPGIGIRDLVYCRNVVDRALLANGWTIAVPLGVLEDPVP